MIEYLDEEIQEIEARMKTLTRADSMKQNAEIIQAMPGVGPVVAASLLAELPELGQADRRAIAALAGLAPIANDSRPARRPKTDWQRPKRRSIIALYRGPACVATLTPLQRHP